MKNVISRFRSCSPGCKGQTLVEYAFILILVAVVVVLMLTQIGGKTNNYFSSANSAFTGR